MPTGLGGLVEAAFVDDASVAVERLDGHASAGWVGNGVNVVAHGRRGDHLPLAVEEVHCGDAIGGEAGEMCSVGKAGAVDDRPRGSWEGGVAWKGGVAEVAADSFVGRRARSCIDRETKLAVGAAGGVEADPVTARDQLQAGREAELAHRRGEAARLAERGRAGCYGRALCREAEQTADVVGEGQ